MKIKWGTAAFPGVVDRLKSSCANRENNTLRSGIEIRQIVMSQPFLSIGIPTHNRFGPLDERVGSLSSIASCYLQQLEIAISDNASTVTTKETVDKYQGPLGLRDFRNSGNIGHRHCMVQRTIYLTL